jgi:copper chaperone CopZ
LQHAPAEARLQACSILDALTLRSTKPPSEEKRSQRRSRQKSAKEHQMETALLKIDGMHCNGCAETIKSVVERQPGVQAAEVSYDRSQARILYDPEAIPERRLVAAVQKLGYRVTQQAT